MKLLFAGLGSIGARHLKDAAEILTERKEDVHFFALRSSGRPLPEDVASLLEKSFYDYNELPNDFDAAYICSPTSLHLEAVRGLADKAAAMFIEKPIFDKPAAVSELPFSRDKLYYVACPLRFSPVLGFAKEYLKNKKVLRISSVCSSYLPDWRPEIDYRRCYSAKSELGGGVRLDLVHELDYLIWLFGAPSKISSLSGNASSLEISSEDYCVYCGQLGSAPFTLALDYFGREPKRALDVVLEDGRAEFDILESEARLYENGSVKTRKFEPVDVRRAEAEYFLDLIGGKTENINPPQQALMTLEAALR